VATKRARGLFGGASEADLEQVHVAVTQAGDTVRVNAEHNTDWSLTKRITVDLEISVPPSVDLDLRLNAGNTRVINVTGSVLAEVNAGNLDLDDVTVGGSSRLQLNAGNLTLRGTFVEGASLVASVNAGSARFLLARDAGVTVDARTTAGSIHAGAEQIQVSRHFASASASGTIGAPRGAQLRARVDAGNLTIDIL
jgi:hypothetical protein